MYEVYFYKDKNGKSPVLDYLWELKGRKDKDSRIKLNKIGSYIEVLRRYGTGAGEPYIKHVQGDIWELRPLRDRIFFAAWDGNGFLLLNCFMKRTRKTPSYEITKAKRNLADYQERSGKK